ncbi:hypothetical protein [Candidatus Borrarchaeum sp.]|uniref:hypothetical protein n=1 Tax=Candidatus Borrarchaeum sp. TaxID=2846742 RepID=UPI002579A5A9|nr:hypothetical protein [Candidatus Borrarchaeum sp.]
MSKNYKDEIKSLIYTLEDYLDTYKERHAKDDPFVEPEPYEWKHQIRNILQDLAIEIEKEGDLQKIHNIYRPFVDTVKEIYKIPETKRKIESE